MYYFLLFFDAPQRLRRGFRALPPPKWQALGWLQGINMGNTFLAVQGTNRKRIRGLGKRGQKYLIK